MNLRERFEEAWVNVTARAKVVVQDKDELFGLIALMHARGANSYLELGASEGVSLYCIGMCLPLGSVIGAIDLCEPHSRSNLFENVDLLRTSGQIVTVYEGTTVAAHAELVKNFNPFSHRVDAILIDAGHSYPDVKQDWELYGQLGKMVAFHDIRLVGPQKLWGEIGGGLELHGDRKRPMGFGVKFQ